MPRNKPEIKVTVEFCDDMEPEEALAGWVRATQILMRTAERMKARQEESDQPAPLQERQHRVTDRESC